MADQEVHSRDLVVQKMTKDGLVEENKTKGTSNHISGRAIDEFFDVETDHTKFKTRTGNVKDHAANSEKRKPQAVKQRNIPVNKSVGSKQEEVSGNKKLKTGKPKQQESKNTACKKNEKKGNSEKESTSEQEGKSDKEGKFKKEDSRKNEGQENQKNNIKEESEENNQNRNERLRDRKPKLLEKNEAPAAILQGNLPRNNDTRYKYNAKNSLVKNKAEKEVFRNDRDNVGWEAVHRGYRGTENIYFTLKRLKRLNKEEHKFHYLKNELKNDNRRNFKQKVESKVFEEKKDNVGLKATYLGYRAGTVAVRTMLKSAKKAPGQSETEKRQTQGKQIQQKQYQRKYAQEIRSKASENIKHFTEFAEKSLQAGAKKLLQLLATNKASLLALCAAAFGGMILYFFIIGAGINFLQMILTEVFAGTYQTDYGSMTESDSIFKNMEVRLEERIKNIETEFPGYDEYRYDLGEIGHDPNLLLAYLGAKFQGFTAEMSEPELVEIFNLMYELNLTEEKEIRTRMVEKTDPITGEDKLVEEEFEYYILHITLKVNNLKDILEGRLTQDEKKQFEIYQDTGGGQNIFPNPLDFDWHSSISSQFGYRIHPISGKLKFHSGVDIAAPAGSPIYSCMEGTVVRAGDNGGYGLCVEIQNKNGDRTKYAHCSKLFVTAGEEVKRRDKIAEVGTTGNSTGNHLHLEFISSDGTLLNPLFIVSNFNR